MRDVLGKFGDITFVTKATKANSEDYIDLGGFQSGSRFTKHSLPDDLYACFRNKTAFNTNDSYKPMLEWDTATNFSTALKSITYPEGPVEIVAGTIVRVKVPRNVTRYLRAAVMPESTGTLTAEVVEVWLEEGAQQQVL